MIDKIHTRRRIFVLIDQVLGHVLLHEFIGRFGHPSRHERGEAAKGMRDEGTAE